MVPQSLLAGLLMAATWLSMVVPVAADGGVQVREMSPAVMSSASEMATGGHARP